MRTVDFVVEIDVEDFVDENFCEIVEAVAKNYSDEFFEEFGWDEVAKEVALKKPGECLDAIPDSVIEDYCHDNNMTTIDWNNLTVDMLIANCCAKIFDDAAKRMNYVQSIAEISDDLLIQNMKLRGYKIFKEF